MYIRLYLLLRQLANMSFDQDIPTFALNRSNKLCHLVKVLTLLKCSSTFSSGRD